MKPLPELLAPAGSPEALDAAIDAGADAVYFGGAAFHARMGARGFSEEELLRAVTRCRTFGVKSYATLNTLLFDREEEAFLKQATALWQMGVDAVIVADPGAMRLLSRYLPALPIHASTQASIHSTDGARAIAALGARRVVLARELSLADITSVTTHAPIETEIFLHGALCVSYSGQCLFSSLVGGRSGNRGECAQPCRLPYSGGYPISLRDLSLADHIPALINSGVSSLKIEGRMKSASYVFHVTDIYRRLLDGRRAATPEENRRLRELFSRDGFTDAYFRARASEPMTGTRTEADKAVSRALPSPPPFSRRVPLTGEVTVQAGQPARLTLRTPDGRVGHAEGNVPDMARSAPLTREALASRIARLGGTDLSLDAAALTVTLEPGLNLSPGAINALRREAVARLCAPPAREVLPRPKIHAPRMAGEKPRFPYLHEPRPGTRPRTVLCFFAEQADALPEDGYDLLFLPLTEWRRAARLPEGVSVPPVIPDSERERVFSALREARAAGITHALCGNLGMIAPLCEMGFIPVGDFRLNVTNREAAAALHEAGLPWLILSPELTLPMLRDVGEGSAIVYGRIPLMLTERCFMKELSGCDRCGSAALTDRRGVRFPILREHWHRNLILNSRPTYMGDRAEELRAHRLSGEHFLFTTETPEEAARVFRSFEKQLPPDGEYRRLGSATTTTRR